MAPPKIPLQKRFDSKTEPCPVTGCLLWAGNRHEDGYGQISIDQVQRGTHRVAYEMAFGPVPKGLHVLHKCDVPACVNPDHLWLGTHADNMSDSVRKGRFAGAHGGERHHMAKLSDAQAEEVRNAAGRQKDIARKFGIGQAQVSRIKTGKNRA